MTVTASGKVLTPMVVFKGQPEGLIVKRELPTFPKDMLYTCQPNAWMDERVMIEWVEMVLKPYIATAPKEITPSNIIKAVITTIIFRI